MTDTKQPRAVKPVHGTGSNQIKPKRKEEIKEEKIKVKAKARITIVRQPVRTGTNRKHNVKGIESERQAYTRNRTESNK